MAELYYAGLDIGGTSGRLKLVTTRGRVIGEYEAKGCSINTDGAEKCRLRYRELMLPVMAELGLLASDCQGICVAASGIDSLALAQEVRAVFEEMGFAADRITVVNDCEIFLYLTDGPSMVVISGTGSICFGRDQSGHVYRTGGWNHIVSDEGSAFDMGLKTIKAAGDCLDGRRECPILTKKVIGLTKMDTLEQLNELVNESLFEKSRLAGLSLAAYEAAAQGEAAAIMIHRECAAALTGLIMDTFRKIQPGTDAADRKNSDLQLWLWGSVLVKNELIRNMVTAEIISMIPGISIGIVPVSALDAAVRIAVENFRPAIPAGSSGSSKVSPHIHSENT